MGKERRRIVLLAVVCVLALAVVGVAIAGAVRVRADKTPLVAPPGESALALPTPKPSRTPTVVKVKEEVTAETLRDGLRDMGLLLTEEYYFTEVVYYSTVKTFLGLELGVTESNFLVSYDGVITAGIDFSGITVEKDEAEKIVTVYVPLPEICSVDVDPNSFVRYSEKSGLGNPLSVSDYNRSLTELEETAAQKAVDRGLLERAAENAQTVIKNFVRSLLGEEECALRILPAEG